jgi:hypothetical protein
LEGRVQYWKLFYFFLNIHYSSISGTNVPEIDTTYFFPLYITLRQRYAGSIADSSGIRDNLSLSAFEGCVQPSHLSVVATLLTGLRAQCTWVTCPQLNTNASEAGTTAPHRWQSTRGTEAASMKNGVVNSGNGVMNFGCHAESDGIRDNLSTSAAEGCVVHRPHSPSTADHLSGLRAQYTCATCPQLNTKALIEGTTAPHRKQFAAAGTALSSM